MKRHDDEPNSRANPAPARTETIDDLIHGQGVIINARWILVGAGLLLVFWRSLSGLASLGEVRVSLVLLIVLAVMNFLLYTEVVRMRRTLAPVVYLASMVDLIVISAIVITQGGFTALSFVFYFPALMALSVAFSPMLTVVYTLGTLVVYAGICLTTSGRLATQIEAFSAPGAGSETATELIILITRLLMMMGVVACGYTYWRVERDRRHQAAEELLKR